MPEGLLSARRPERRDSKCLLSAHRPEQRDSKCQRVYVLSAHRPERRDAKHLWQVWLD